MMQSPRLMLFVSDCNPKVRRNQPQISRNLLFRHPMLFDLRTSVLQLAVERCSL